VLVRRYRRFDACEDAVQEALLPRRSSGRRGRPDSPRAGWYGRRARLADQLRSEHAAAGARTRRARRRRRARAGAGDEQRRATTTR
jgi:hypothetical protein